MRRFDKKYNIQKANLLSEQRYLESKGVIKENLDEEYYDNLEKPMEGQYVDTNELVGQRLFFHTNRSNRNAKRNGMIGIYGVKDTGKMGKREELYTNEVRLVAPILFQSSDSATASIAKTGHRTLNAGVTGVVASLEGMGSGIPATYNPFDKDGASWFYLIDDKEKKELESAEEVYFLATEGGEWKFLVKNPVYGKRKIPSEADRQTSLEFPEEEPKLAAELTEYGLAGMPKNKFGGDSPYFETLSQALDLVREYAEKLGYEVDEHDMWFQFGTGGIGYEESKSANIGLLKNGKPILDKREKELNRYIHVSINRMPSGKYELTMYKTF